LKRLSDAIADNDHIYATVKGAALNNDGSDKASFTAPSVRGQAEVIAMAQADAGVAPEQVTYVETHGTATPLGDPIEVEALTLAFTGGNGNGASAGQHCAIGSIKSNIGHTDGRCRRCRGDQDFAGLATRRLSRPTRASQRPTRPSILHIRPSA
jgi:acyl transferase domain-containing protein